MVKTATSENAKAANAALTRHMGPTHVRSEVLDYKSKVNFNTVLILLEAQDSDCIIRILFVVLLYCKLIA